ncbi:class I SAM-dependent methyltransferase [Nocardiopsis alba]|uniref:SAM-dependent methyltransferase n=1 Tax=Nocardiopsis alba TaxID=53437 RepID=UPI0033B6AFC8
MTPETNGDSGAFTDEAVWSRLDAAHLPLGPFSDTTIDRLIRSARLGSAPRILDIGCGLGAWILRALELHPDAHGVGIDISRKYMDRAVADAERRGLGERFVGHVGDAWDMDLSEEGFDLVICVGLSDPLGGTEKVLRELIRPRLRDGGLILLGEPFWERPPNQVAQRALGVSAERYPDADGVYDRVMAGGGLPIDVHVSTITEWDEYMWACVRALAEWGLDDAPHEQRAGILRFMADYRDAWLREIRGTLGFTTLLLRPLPLPLSILTGRRPDWAAKPRTR